MAKNRIDWLYHILNLIVVFIGITAGFVLQNKKEAKINRSDERHYIQGFKDEIKADIESLDRFITDDSTWFVQQSPKIALLASDSLSDDSAMALIASMLNFSEFKPYDNTYSNIINSGNLSLIRDYDVRQSIVEYYKTVEDYQIIDKYFHLFNTETFMPFVFTNIDLISNQFRSAGEQNNSLFRNIVVAYRSYTKQRLDGFTELRNNSIETLKILEEHKN
ncbi:MAG: hypothetical protein JXR19_09460 [Bacteroidia bacterium]